MYQINIVSWDMQTMFTRLLLLIFLSSIVSTKIIPDCTDVDRDNIPTCVGSILRNEGPCGESVCAKVTKILCVSLTALLTNYK